MINMKNTQINPCGRRVEKNDTVKYAKIIANQNKKPGYVTDSMLLYLVFIFNIEARAYGLKGEIETMISLLQWFLYFIFSSSILHLEISLNIKGDDFNELTKNYKGDIRSN
jgi:hypothetical protein